MNKKVDRLETHDRYLEFGKQNESIGHAVQECIWNVPDAVDFPFYVFGHFRSLGEDEKFSIGVTCGWDNIPDGRLIWMPRITKPKPEPNSYLFLCRKNSDIIETIWILPKEELFDNYAPEQMTHEPDIWTCILNYRNCRDKLAAPDKNGPSKNHEKKWRKIYVEAKKQAGKSSLAQLELS